MSPVQFRAQQQGPGGLTSEEHHSTSVKVVQMVAHAPEEPSMAARTFE